MEKGILEMAWGEFSLNPYNPEVLFCVGNGKKLNLFSKWNWEFFGAGGHLNLCFIWFQTHNKLDQS